MVKNELRDSKLLRFNIQLFAEGDGEGGEPSGTPEPTKSDNELKLEAELAKLKKANDDLSSENATHKKKAKAQLSEDEQAKLLLEETQGKLAEMERKVMSAELTATLTKGGFEVTEVTDLVKAALDNDVNTLATVLIKSRETTIAKALADAKKEFQAATPLPGQGGKNEDPNVAFGASLRSGTGNSSVNSARELYGNKN